MPDDSCAKADMPPCELGTTVDKSAANATIADKIKIFRMSYTSETSAERPVSKLQQIDAARQSSEAIGERCSGAQSRSRFARSGKCGAETVDVTGHYRPPGVKAVGVGPHLANDRFRRERAESAGRARVT